MRTFDTASPGVVTTVGSFSGAATSVQDIDFRISNGLLYGYNRSTNSVVTIDPTTAFTTLASTPTTASNNTSFGIDFNPVADRLRLVNLNDQNLRIDVATGATTVDGTLAYAAGDPNFGVNPSILQAAYTNNDNNPGTGTTLFYLDVDLNTLVSTSNPNGGVLNTVGALGVDITVDSGFDIFTDANGVNTGYVLSSPGSATFYTINLATGAATSVGAFGAVHPFGLAIAPPAPPAVPEPGTALAGVMMAGLCGALRRRRA